MFGRLVGAAQKQQCAAGEAEGDGPLPRRQVLREATLRSLEDFDVMVSVTENLQLIGIDDLFWPRLAAGQECRDGDAKTVRDDLQAAWGRLDLPRLDEMNRLSGQLLACDLRKTEPCAQTSLPQNTRDDRDAGEAPAWPSRT
jgi:hypothetical protein